MKKINYRIFRNDTFIGCVLSLFAFSIFLKTLAPSVSFIDCGELSAAAATLGIAHPTGYPLFSLLGWMFAHVPIGGRIIWRLNLMTAVFASTAIFFFYQFFLLLLSCIDHRNYTRRSQSSKQSKSNEIENPFIFQKQAAAAVAALILAFSSTYWEQATSIEVYSLHLLLLSILLYLFTRSILKNPRTNKLWYLFAYTLGLSFTNHMSTIMLAPGFLYFYFMTYGFSRDSWIKIAKSSIPFFIGLSLYAYLPIRAMQNPIMNWGDPTTVDNFMRHFLGTQYHYRMFSASEVPAKQAHKFLIILLTDFGYAPLIFIPIGLSYLFRRLRKILIFSVLLFLGCLLYSLNYDILDTDSYFLLAYIAVIIWISFGLFVSLNFSFMRKRLWLVAIVGVGLVLMPICLNYSANDESQEYAVEDYVKNVFGSLDSNAVIFSDDEESFTSPANYFQWVEAMRPDVAVINYSLLQIPWYYKQLAHQHPWLFQNSQPVVEAYLNKYSDYQFDSGVYDSRMQVIRSLIYGNYHSHSIYITNDLSPIFAKTFSEFHGIPAGLTCLITRDSVPMPFLQREFSFRPLPNAGSTVDRYVEYLKKSYANAYVNEGGYRAMIGDRPGGVYFLRKALEVKPGYSVAQSWLQQLGEEP